MLTGDYHSLPELKLLFGTMDRTRNHDGKSDVHGCCQYYRVKECVEAFLKTLKTFMSAFALSLLLLSLNVAHEAETE